MKISYVLGFTATAALMLATSIQPSAAMVIYPWCVQYGQDTSNCGFTSFQQCLATASGNGNNCRPNAWYTPYPPPNTYSPPLRR